jgi:hypothetical protein
MYTWNPFQPIELVIHQFVQQVFPAVCLLLAGVAAWALVMTMFWVQNYLIRANFSKRLYDGGTAHGRIATLPRCLNENVYIRDADWRFVAVLLPAVWIKPRVHLAFDLEDLELVKTIFKENNFGHLPRWVSFQPSCPLDQARPQPSLRRV